MLFSLKTQLGIVGGEVSSVELWGVTSNCYHCSDLPLLTNITQNNVVSNKSVALDSRYPFHIVFKIVTTLNQNLTHNCTFHFNENATYTLSLIANNVSDPFQKSYKCLLHEGNLIYTKNKNNNNKKIDKEGISTYLPILIAVCVYAGIAIAYVIACYFYRIYKARQQAVIIEQSDDKPNRLLQNQKQEVEQEIKNKNKNRIRSIDAFRGLSITIMIFVNYGGGGYYFFDHSTWNGLTVADLVFPWFIFIMGSSMSLSFNSLQRRGVSTTFLFKKTIRRAIILFGLGLFLNDGFVTSQWRIPGVLQRFSISYLVVSAILLYVPKLNKNNNNNNNNKVKSSVNREEEALLPNVIENNNNNNNNIGILMDVLPYALEWLVIIILIVIWLLVTFLLNVPGCGKGYLGPGGIGDYGEYRNCTGGAAGYIDKIIFGEQHIYNSPTCQDTYLTGSYDPEGALGYLTSIALCYFGVQVGRIFILYNDPITRMKRWFLWGIFFGVIGTILCYGRANGGPIPINKNLWSLSFILAMAGSANVVLTICYFLIDLSNIWNGAPFIYIGMNPILIYLSHEILNYYPPFSWYIAVPTHMNLLTMNLVGVSSWLLIAYYMHYHKFYINI